MKDNELLIFVLTAILDISVGIITLEVLGMIFISSLEIVSVYVIMGTVPIIILTDSLINKLKKNEELK